MSEECKRDQMVKTDVLEGPVEKVACNKIVEEMQKMKSGKASGPSEVSVKIIGVSDKNGVKVVMELCLRDLDGRGMPDEWKTGVIVSIFKEKCDVMSCGSYKGVKLLEYATKIIERVLEIKILNTY